MFFLNSFFQSQFMFFIAREFYLDLYDEYVIKSVTKRVHIVQDRKSQSLYCTDLNVQQVHDNVYKTLRRTYQKL